MYRSLHKDPVTPIIENGTEPAVTAHYSNEQLLLFTGKMIVHGFGRVLVLYIWLSAAFTYAAVQRQKAVSAYFTSEQILPFGFEE